MIDEILTTRPRTTAILVAVLLGFAGGGLLSLAGDAVVVRATGRSGGLAALASGPSPWWATVLGFAGLWAGLALAIRWASHHGGLTWRSRSFAWAGPRDLLFLVVGAGTQVVVDLAYQPFHLHHLSDPVHHEFGATGGVAFMALVLLVTLAAPVVEESVFRATLFRVLAIEWGQRFGSRGVATAMVGSALVFALVHGEVLQFPGLWTLGMVTALVYHRTQRLLPSVLTHVGFNALTAASLIVHRFA